MKTAVVGIVFGKNRREVLILNRRDVNMWVFPAGGVEKGESNEQAVCREVLEETGLQVQVDKLVGIYTPVNKLAQMTYVFECKIVKGKLSLGSETRAIRFYPVDKLPSNFFHIHYEWLIDALQNSPSVIKRQLKNITYKQLFIYFCKHPIRIMRTLLSRIGLPINSRHRH